MQVEHKGWVLETDEDQDSDGFIRYEHYAVKDGVKQNLHGSSFLTTFTPTQERFAWLVDHGFPRASRGNWHSHEIDERIANGD